jgi:hypothetical protein
MSPSTDADEKGNETQKSPLPRPTGRNANAGGGADADVEKYAEPDAGGDRDAPAQPAAPDRGEPQIKKPPLEIKQIEDLEDDAKGG